MPFPQGVHPLVAGRFTSALDRLWSAGWRMPPADVPGGPGMWGQESRPIVGSGVLSFHHYGLALDCAAPWNPLGVANPAPSPYRLPDQTSALVEPLGLLWGGSPRFGSRPDRMHIECHLSPRELTGIITPQPGTHPFPLPLGYYYGPLSGPTESISGQARSDGPYRAGLAEAQTRLGTNPDGFYGPMTAGAARSWQSRHGLQVDGLIGVHTWLSLFP